MHNDYLLFSDFAIKNRLFEYIHVYIPEAFHSWFGARIL